MGTLVEADGSAYYGFWARGKLHGEGVLLSSEIPTALHDGRRSACTAVSGQRETVRSAWAVADPPGSLSPQIGAAGVHADIPM